MTLTTLINSTTAGDLFTASPPFTANVTQAQIRAITNPLLSQYELNQPEGAALQLTITNLSNAATLASKLNTQFQEGKLVDQPTGEPVLAWQGYSTIAQASGSTLTIRWRKGQAFIVPILWGIVIIIAIIGIYLLIKELSSSPWSLAAAKTTSTTAAATAAGPLGIPWWEWILGTAVVVVVVPVGMHEYKDYVVAHGQVKQAVQQYGPL